ncbi:MAG: glycosyltransferase family 87 protein [Bacteroidia bacterium]
MLLNKYREKVKKFVPKVLLKEKTMLWVLLIVSLLISIQRLTLGPWGYNNYLIYSTSFSHLCNDLNLYNYYWGEYIDLYLYSPTFALLMTPFVVFPMWFQVILWCCLSAICIFYAIKLLSFDNGSKRVFICWYILIEYITSVQNTQVTAIMVSFIIFSFVFFERGNLFKAAFFIVLATFIKIFAIAAAILFLMYPGKLKFIAYMLFWGILFFLAPLLVISYDLFLFQYHTWFNVTMSVHQSEEIGNHPNVSNALSLMGLLKAWFNVTLPAIYIQLAGTVLLCAPFLRVKYYSNYNFRLLMLASILIWSMVFNHVAESASYLIAIIGVAIWYVTDKKDILSNILIVAVFILSILSPTSLFPSYIRQHYIIPYVLKALPCIIVWFLLQYRLLSGKFNTEGALQG